MPSCLKPGLKPITAVVAILVLTIGCTVQLAYMNLDRLVIRWVDDKVDLNAEQKRLVRRALDDNLSWHCADHLPQYAAMLNSLGDDLNDDRIDVATMVSYSEQVTQFGQELIEVSIEPATQLLASLDERQVEHLFLSFEESNEELLERLGEADVEKTQTDRAERMTRRLSRFMGRLNRQQLARLSQWSVDYQPIDGHQLAYAHQWQTQLKEALALRHDQPDEFAQSIAVLFEPTRGWDDSYRQAVEANQALTFEAIADVLNLATDRQKDRLMAKLGGYASDFDALTCSVPEQLAALD
ncbi:MAG: DUF6279 family lipoprotein [Wenzhouxiangella sp.]|nr:DUF6279 family lipoprotein [Wenzhouxiangella sp.]